jgi:hypothetical protein
MQIIIVNRVEEGYFRAHAETAKIGCSWPLHHVVDRGIERGAGRGLEAVGGACTESILPGGGEEIGVYRGLGCAVLRVTTSLVKRHTNSEGVGNLDQYL